MPERLARWTAVACALHAFGLYALIFALLVLRPAQPLADLQPHAPPAGTSVACAITASVLYSDRVVLPSGVAPALVHVDDGAIMHVEQAAPEAAAAYARARGLRFEDFRGEAISPGLIDVHVHVSAVGGRGWEGYATATKAAAAGGITTIVGMPLNSLPPTVSVDALEAEVAKAAAEGLHCDVGLWGGVVPSSLGRLQPLLADERVLGLKAFLSPLPRSAGYEAVHPDELRTAAKAAASAAVPLLVHCELMTTAEMEALQPDITADPNASRRFATFLATRPPLFERRAIEALVGLVEEIPSLRAHVVHLSDAGSLQLLRQAKRASGGRLSVETCPHYLVFSAEEVPDGETRLKCLPPIRGAANREGLWEGLSDGTVDLIASDHSPCAPELRALSSGDFLTAWAGISGLQSSLQATWTAAASRGWSLTNLSHWWSEGPATLAGLTARKGRIAAGMDADLVVWSPEAPGVSDRLYTRHAGSPYAGRSGLLGRVRLTLVRGRRAFSADPESIEGPSHGPACGMLLRRETERAIEASQIRN